MKRLLFFPALLLAVLCASAQDNAFVATPITYTFFLTDDENFCDNGMGCQITYGITGENIAEIERDSRRITSITDENGKDLLAYNRGGPKWNLGPTVYNDGKRAEFHVFIATKSPLVLPKIAGTINVRTASQLETQTLTFKTADKGVEQTAGPFTFFIYDESTRAHRFANDIFTMVIQGDYNLLKEVAIIADGEKIRSGSHTPEKGKTYYYFNEAPATAEFTLSVTYHADMQVVPVRFGGEPAFAFAQEDAPDAKPDGNAFSAKPVQYKFLLPEGEGFFNDGFGCKITYGITGKNIVDVKNDSRHISSIVDENGEDLFPYFYANRKYNYLPSTFDDGKRAKFYVFVATETPMTLPEVSGFIYVKTADKPETQTLTFKTADKGVASGIIKEKYFSNDLL